MALKFRGLIGAIVMLGALSANLPGVPAMAATQTAAPVVAVAGEVAETGGISGRLLDPAGGGGLAGTQVGITPAISCRTSSGTRYASTDESGEFAVTGLPVGGYRIQVLGSTLPQPQYAPGTLDSTTATVVHVVADQVTAVPAFTPIAGGTVVPVGARGGTGDGGGLPLA